VVYGSVQFDISSKITGRTYRIFVFKPDTPPPTSSGYPLIIATDGNMTFPIMATLDAAFALTGKAALIVGVGYPSDDPVDLFSLRTRDLTPPTPLSALPQRSGQPPAKLEDYGGSEEFFRFLTEELRPFIAGAYSVDADDQTLYGHSIAGMFVLGTLLNHPASFRNFIASSPSIWWNKRSVLNGVPDFERKVRAGEAAPRVLILVGGSEQDVPATLPPQLSGAITKKLPLVPSPVKNRIARIFVKKMMLDYRMVDNARDLATCLQQIKGGPRYRVSFRAFEEEDHLTVLPASIGRALAFALRP
jgi:predicted alpha/beta superfamily hydrolase